MTARLCSLLVSAGGIAYALGHLIAGLVGGRREPAPRPLCARCHASPAEFCDLCATCESIEWENAKRGGPQMWTAEGARRVDAQRGPRGLLVMGGRRFDADLIGMVERAYEVAEWRMTGSVTFAPQWTTADTADRLAFAFVEGRALPVASVAPLRKGAPR